MTTAQSTSTQTQGPFAPQVFGKYFLVDKVATGGMAEIFKAKTYGHGGFENLLVIKRILPHISENPEFNEMFVDEAKVSVALQHPNIVRIYDFGKILQNSFIAMECVDGKDVRNVLRKLARKKEWLPHKFCAFVALETCKGLHYAHTKTDLQGNAFGIVHRDVSPSNVMVSYEGEVKVADFGIAKAESNAYQTRDGHLKGKFEYMSPEQAQGRDIDHRSDLFSLGIVLYEMMTGRRLFKSDSELTTLKRIRDCEFEPPDIQKPDLPPALVAICMRALTKEPEDRYPSAQAMADELREFLFPETPDTLQRELREYMQALFAEEIAEERSRLESGAAVARELKDKIPNAGDWDAQADSTMSQVTQTTVQAVVPWIAAIGLGMLGMFAVALVGVVWLVANQTGTGESDGNSVTVVRSDGTGLDVVVFPDARILVNGELKHTGKTWTVTDLAPGTYLVRLEAEGFVPAEETVQVETNSVVKVLRQLEPVKAEVVPPTVPAPVDPPVETPTPSGPPRVEFRSSPSGATVLIEGKSVGTTPLTFDDVALGKSYAIEMRLDGHESARGTLRDVKKGNQRYALTLEPAKAPATLSVTLVGGGWANVYLDGAKLPKTAPLKEFQVAPGKHEIRVENEALGIDVTETHTFGGGQSITIRAAPK